MPGTLGGSSAASSKLRNRATGLGTPACDQEFFLTKVMDVV